MTRTIHYCDSQMLQKPSVLPPWAAFSLCKDYTKKDFDIFLLWSWSPRLAHICNVNKERKGKYFCWGGHQAEQQSWRCLLRSRVCLFPVENSSASCQQRVLKFNGTHLPGQEAAQCIPVRLCRVQTCSFHLAWVLSSFNRPELAFPSLI